MGQDSRNGAIDQASWLGQQMSEAERKRVVLDALRDSLAVWEHDVDWAGLTEEKQQALLKLAEESKATLKSMIERLEAELAAGAKDNGSAKDQGVERRG